MRAERAMTSRIHCIVASSGHQGSKLNKKTALPILFVSLREGKRRRRGAWRKTRNTSSLVLQPGNFVTFRGGARWFRKRMSNKIA